MTTWTLQVMVREHECPDSAAQTIAVTDYRIPSTLTGAVVTDEVRRALKEIHYEARRKIERLMETLHQVQP